MRYTGPKFKLCRREQVDLFWSAKYNVKKNRSLPGQHGGNMQRSSEYGKLLRNKQVLKRMYMLSERQFVRLVKETAAKYAKNKNITHDTALFQFLERRMDSVVYRSWLAKTMMQARQMVTHGHFLLNGKKHNIPSSFIAIGDKITLKDKLKTSALYSQNAAENKGKVPSWVKLDKGANTVEMLNDPQVGELGIPADILKVIEFYARA